MKAIILDFDGTIFNTEECEFIAWQYVYEKHGQMLSFQAWQARFEGDGGDLSFNPFSNLKELTGQNLNLEDITTTRRAKLKQLIEEIKPLPGIIQLLNTCRSLNINLAIASSAPRYWITGLLKKFELLEYFNLILSKDEVKRIKPNTDVYLEALKRMGIQPYDAVAIEDSPIGAIAAISSGLQCIVVPNNITQSLRFPEKVLFIKKLTQLNIHNLVIMMPSDSEKLRLELEDKDTEQSIISCEKSGASFTFLGGDRPKSPVLYSERKYSGENHATLPFSPGRGPA